MKKRLLNTKKTSKYLSSLPRIYALGYWAHFGVREYYFSGKYKTIDNISIPLVYDYYDCNGACDEWRLVPLTSTTTGTIILWSQNQKLLLEIAEIYNRKAEKND